ncbi:unnamed protein product [Spirodela intermedia]|uniref:Uncharacterized protein n=1 Tax=Spirodela intermedia TaxID=51605 RepID=A0A7I8JRS1_SPIIN|nr:unnamed protein product [Spirodela intermedia]CAA6672263.1 unnamed protein product [Spirodela intermedia]
MGGTHEHQRQCVPWRRPPWRSTLIAQVLLFVALYGALSIGRTQMPRSGDEESGYISMTSRHRDLYFISVGGGSRPRDQQMQLLRQMENIARTFKVEFVVNLSELGKKDPLVQNVSFYFPHLRVPWYATSVSSERGSACFLRKIKSPRGHTLDLIGLDTGLWQASSCSEDLMKQQRWLARTLAAIDSTWRVVVGFHSLAAGCGEGHAAEKTRAPTSAACNVYLSGQCCGGDRPPQSGLSFIHSCGSHSPYRGTGDGFHLHGFSPLKIESYFIDSNGDITSRSRVHQWGREVA